jgi:hypothetical protein
LEDESELLDIRGAVRLDSLYSSLVMVRVMQLNLAGHRNFYTTWVQGLKYDNKRLARLIFESKDGIDGFKTEAVEKVIFICSICLNYVNIIDKVKGLPCTGSHNVHPHCLEERTETCKYCSEDEEYIL